MDAHSEAIVSFNGVGSGGRLLRDMVSLIDQHAKDYIDNFRKLRVDISEHANITVAVMVHRVCGELQTIGKPIPSFLESFFSIIDFSCRGFPTPERGQICRQSIWRCRRTQGTVSGWDAHRNYRVDPAVGYSCGLSRPEGTGWQSTRPLCACFVALRCGRLREISNLAISSGPLTRAQTSWFTLLL